MVSTPSNLRSRVFRDNSFIVKEEKRICQWTVLTRGDFLLPYLLLTDADD
jgi:hypothetical protein